MEIRFNTYITLDDKESFYSLVDNTKSRTNTIDLIIGGQLGKFEECVCVPISMVIEAAKTFYELGVMDDSLTWEQV